MRAGTGAEQAPPPTHACPDRRHHIRWETSEGVVNALHPGLKDSRKPGQMRRYSSLLRMADVAARYHENVLAGAHNPTAATANQLGLSAATARALVHRARQADLLPPANPRAGAQPVAVQESRDDQLRILNAGWGSAIVTRAPVEDEPS